MREIIHLDDDDKDTSNDIIERLLQYYNETSTQSLFNESSFYEPHNQPNNKRQRREQKQIPVIMMPQQQQHPTPTFHIRINPQPQPNYNYDEEDDDSENYDFNGNPYLMPRQQKQKSNKDQKSKHFEIITNSSYTFKDVGGYANIKKELLQCIEILSNFTKYEKYNVRIPKGLILEGSPGNGKTLLVKALAGESNLNFISVSGSEFQDKYVGVGSTRVRELFELAKKNVPCIIFIDEIDAIGRKRSSDDESSSNERDSTLNELLVALDGFKSTNGVFIIGATNRADLLDPALLRPGRMDKRIYITNPDRNTRKEVIDIHINGKPYDTSIVVDNMVDSTNGLSCAQIENLLNEAMLNALRDDKEQFSSYDIEIVMNKIVGGWQPTEHVFTPEMIDQIAIHELGHAIVGTLAKHHSNVTKVVINLSSPKSPGYTIFENDDNNFYRRESLFEHIMVLLSGRIAEEVFFGKSITTGAVNDFEEAYKVAERMVVNYGMGDSVIYPRVSEKYKEIIDTEVVKIIQRAYHCSMEIIESRKTVVREGADMLLRDKVIYVSTLLELLAKK